MPIKEVVDMHYRAGGSDKVYHVALEEVHGGWNVKYAFGRRGSSLSSGNKNIAPMPVDKARAMMKKIINEKAGKGYIRAPGCSGDIFGQADSGQQSSPKQIFVDEAMPPKRPSGHQPQLLNTITEEEAEALIKDDAWCMQEKFDGRRTALDVKKGVTTGINKKGQVIPVMNELFQEAAWNSGSYLVDGEAIGSSLYAFDLLQAEGIDLRNRSYASRHQVLSEMLLNGDFSKIVAVPTAFTAKDKRILFDKVKTDRGEGLVFKKVSSVYSPGRPNSGGDHLKFKFTSQETFKVVNKNTGKRSVYLASYDVTGATWIDVGKVTIPPNKEVPPVDSFVEVRYLYYFPGGSIFQPNYEGPSVDVDEFDCDIKKLKIKQGEEEEE